MAELKPDDRTLEGAGGVSWHVSRTRVGYREAEAFMRERALQIAAGNARELVWALEHEALYTAGTSARPEDLLNASQFPVFDTGRGGQHTYHGPGQRVVYVMLDLRQRGGRDVRRFVSQLESWLIASLSGLGVTGEARETRVGVWVRRPEIDARREDKVAAIGIRLVRWVSLHGISLNVSVDLSHYDGIVACGVREHGITSLKDLGLAVSMDEVDAALAREFRDVFGAKIGAPKADDPVLAFA